jgi:hypothetical protein
VDRLRQIFSARIHNYPLCLIVGVALWTSVADGVASIIAVHRLLGIKSSDVVPPDSDPSGRYIDGRDDVRSQLRGRRSVQCPKSGSFKPPLFCFRFSSNPTSSRGPRPDHLDILRSVSSGFALIRRRLDDVPDPPPTTGPVEGVLGVSQAPGVTFERNEA